MAKKSPSTFGDSRLDLAFSKLVENLTSRWTLTLRKLGENFAEATRFDRFINNPKVTPSLLIKELWEQSSFDSSGKHLLVISDTSTLSFRPFAKREELGMIRPASDLSGFDVHPSILVDAQTLACYGLGGLTYYQRKRYDLTEGREERKKRQKQRNAIPFDEKERIKWFTSPAQAIDNCSGADSYTLVGDREADIYELMIRVKQRDWHFLYRSKTNRITGHLEDGSPVKLHDTISKQPVADSYQVMVQKTEKRSAHLATLDLKFGQTTICRSTAQKDKHLPLQLGVFYVEVKENSSSVVGKEKPIHWILLSSHQVFSVAQARQLVRWYIARWDVEQVFRTVKLKGLDIENTRYEKFHGLCNMATMALIAACMTMQLRRAFEGQTNEPGSAIFLPIEEACLVKLSARLEGSTEKLKNPHPSGSLAFAAWVIARLAGWSGYNSAGKPGPITLIEGMAKFCLIAQGFVMAQPPPEPTSEMC